MLKCIHNQRTQSKTSEKCRFSSIKLAKIRGGHFWALVGFREIPTLVSRWWAVQPLWRTIWKYVNAMKHAYALWPRKPNTDWVSICVDWVIMPIFPSILVRMDKLRMGRENFPIPRLWAWPCDLLWTMRTANVIQAEVWQVLVQWAYPLVLFFGPQDHQGRKPRLAYWGTKDLIWCPLGQIAYCLGDKWVWPSSVIQAQPSCQRTAHMSQDRLDQKNTYLNHRILKNNKCLLLWSS